MENVLRINDLHFPIVSAEFAHLPEHFTEEVDGWQFQIKTAPSSDVPEGEFLSGYSPRFYAEGAALPLAYADDLTGTVMHVKEAFSAEHEEPHFTLYCCEHGDLTDVTLKFLEKRGAEYRISVTATIPPGTIYSEAATLTIDTWIKLVEEC